MKPRRLSAITQVPPSDRFRVLAEGARLLAENVAVLEADAKLLDSSRSNRGAAVLRSFAEEEAAKIVILLDLARVGWQDSAAVRACLTRFYEHLARGLYVNAYDGSPADLAELRRFVDTSRQEYYLDGPMDVDWIFRNEVSANREERLYVDYIEDEHGARRWTGPADRAATFDEPFQYPTPASRIVRLAAAMNHIGLLTEQGFSATREVWDGVVVTDATHWSEVEPLNIAVIERLAAALGRRYESDADRVIIRYVINHWTFPLVSLDMKVAKVRLEDLQRERERRLAREMGTAND